MCLITDCITIHDSSVSAQDLSSLMCADTPPEVPPDRTEAAKLFLLFQRIYSFRKIHSKSCSERNVYWYDLRKRKTNKLIKNKECENRVLSNFSTTKKLSVFALVCKSLHSNVKKSFSVSMQGRRDHRLSRTCISQQFSLYQQIISN